MFAKITSQVREQCKCLLIILLILQTVPVSFFFFAAHSFPRLLQIERNKSLGVLHSCFSNPTGWGCHETLSILIVSRAWRGRPFLLCPFSDHITSGLFSVRQEISFPPLQFLICVARFPKDLVVVAQTSPCWTNSSKGHGQQRIRECFGLEKT